VSRITVNGKIFGKHDRLDVTVCLDRKHRFDSRDESRGLPGKGVPINCVAHTCR